MKHLDKRSRSAHFFSVKMHIWISGVTAVSEFTHLWRLHHQFEVGGNSSPLHYWVSWFRRNLPVNFRRQTSYLSHVLSAVNIKSQLGIYFTSRKTQLNKTSCTYSKLNEEFQIFGPLGNVSFKFTKYSWLNAGKSWLNSVQNIL